MPYGKFLEGVWKDPEFLSLGAHGEVNSDGGAAA